MGIDEKCIRVRRMIEKHSYVNSLSIGKIELKIFWSDCGFSDRGSLGFGFTKYIFIKSRVKPFQSDMNVFEMIWLTSLPIQNQIGLSRERKRESRVRSTRLLLSRRNPVVRDLIALFNMSRGSREKRRKNEETGFSKRDNGKKDAEEREEKRKDSLLTELPQREKERTNPTALLSFTQWISVYLIFRPINPTWFSVKIMNYYLETMSKSLQCSYRGCLAPSCIYTIDRTIGRRASGTGQTAVDAPFLYPITT